MSQQELHHLLSLLKEELEDLESSSESHKEISSLITNIELQIQTLEDKQQHRPLTENIRNHIEKFETEHPRITGILNDIMMKLSNIGI